MSYCSVRNNLTEDTRYGYVSNLIVEEEKRRTGVGEMLIRNIVEYFKRNHIQSIRLALKTNLDSAAQTLFQKLGFNEIFRVFELKL